MDKGKIYSISISSQRGTLKNEVFEGLIVENFGIENDGHGGDWGRQITCLDYASLLKSNNDNNLNMGPGDFAENILIENLDFAKISVGTKLKLGQDAVIEVTQIGKEDHPSVVTRTFGVSLLPYEGLFCRVVAGGAIKKGDTVVLL